MGRHGNIYQRIDGTQWRHVWVVGDIHGCFSMLMAKLRQYRFDPRRICWFQWGCYRPWTRQFALSETTA